MLRARQRINSDLSIDVEADTAQELITELAFFNEWPVTCPLCDSALTITHRRPKGFEYYGLRCVGPIPHECTFGEHKNENGGGLYYKRDAWQEAPRGRSQDDDYDQSDPEPNRQQRAMQNGERAGGYGGQTGARQSNPPPPTADGPCPKCHAPFGKAHGKPCTAGNAYGRGA